MTNNTLKEFENFESYWYIHMNQIGQDLAHYARLIYEKYNIKISQQDIENWSKIKEKNIQDLAHILHDWTESRIKTLKLNFDLQAINAKIYVLEQEYKWKVLIPNEICTLQRSGHLKNLDELNSLLTNIEKMRTNLEEEKRLEKEIEKLKADRENLDKEWKNFVKIEKALTEAVINEFEA